MAFSLFRESVECRAEPMYLDVCIIRVAAAEGCVRAGVALDRSPRKTRHLGIPEKPRGQVYDCCAAEHSLRQLLRGSLRRTKKTPPSRQRFYQSVVFLSFDHIPQRVQFRLAE